MFKKVKNIFKEVTIILLGIFFTLAFIELSLLTFSKLERIAHKIQNNFSKTDEFVILALGESTTAPVYDFNMKDYSWPAMLQEVLDETNLQKKIKVINAGISGINSERILKDLEDNINKYNPNLVVSMMGVNDLFEDIVYETTADIKADSLLYKSRTYKLIKFLIANLKEKSHSDTKKEPNCDSEKTCLNLASKQKIDDFLETEFAITLLEKALEYNPNNTTVLLDLGYRYTSDYNIHRARDSLKAVTLFEKVIEIDPQNPESYYALIDSLSYSRENIENTLKNIEYIKASIVHIPNYKMHWLEYSEKYRQKWINKIENNYKKIENNIEKYEIDNEAVFLALANFYMSYEDFLVEKNKDRLFYLQKTLEFEPNNPHIFFDLARYYAQLDDLVEAEKLYLRTLESDQKDGTYIMALIELANIYVETDRQELAAKVFEQSTVIGGMYVRNHKKLYQKLNDKNIKLIVVQYPMRSIRSLELIFKNNDDVLLTDNESNFKNIVKEKGYSSIFVDRFAGDFGHCSEEGNLLLAENIASVIVENWEKIIR